MVSRSQPVVSSAQFRNHGVLMLRGSTRLLQPWRTSSRMTYKSSSATSDVSPAPFGLRIIRAMQPSAARGKTAECVAIRSRRSCAPRHRQVAPLR